ncbi:hypothetical protein [Microbaculum marinum]|uniref:Uncharacterized protein n=1 Tax=Microbaculum marinum TaxID=1764581 RepID=A0AAW9RJR4_9HYPH
MVWQLGELIQACLIAWMAALAAVVAMKLFSGRISLNGILAATPNGGFDPTRVQSALIFLFIIGGYALQGLDAVATRGPMPEIPETLLVLLTGSNGVYLTGKIVRHRMAG